MLIHHHFDRRRLIRLLILIWTLLLLLVLIPVRVRGQQLSQQPQSTSVEIVRENPKVSSKLLIAIAGETMILCILTVSFFALDAHLHHRRAKSLRPQQ